MKSLFRSIGDFFHFTRAYQWYPGKIPLMLGFALTMLLAEPGQQHGLLWVLAAYVLTCLFLAASYMLNNIADREADSKANKRMGLDGWSRGKQAIPVIIFTALTLVGGIVLMPASAIFAMIGCYILSWSYSCPPLRFKEHTLLGPFVPAFTQVPAPALVMVVAWGALPLPALIYLMIVFFYLLRMLFVHQLLDYENDRIAGTYTTAIQLGFTAMQRLLFLTFTLELVCLIVFLVLLVSAGFSWILLIGLAWPLFIVILRWSRRELIRLDSYSYIPLADIHESLLPLILAVGVAMREKNLMIAIVPLMVFLFLKRHIERLVIPLLGWKE
ncbi:MAG: prenyltransferase [Phycisphaerales bacterium]|nr:prenyltransferase [Phycisphaerales bacterium]